MTQNQFNRKNTIRNSSILLLSGIGLIVCITVLFPQTRRMIMDMAAHIMHREASTYQSWLIALFSYAMGGICLILFFDYCTLTQSGKALVQKVSREVKDCLSEIDFRSFLKPGLLIFGVYLLGILTIIRANFTYLDDLGRTVTGGRGWYGWSRYVSEFSSIIVHGDTNLTDISPLPQLLAILILSVSSVLFVYVIGKRKITTVRLLASVPLGLSPYFLECLAYKFDAPYMALSILACIVPFLFITRKKAFIFTSVVSLLVMCMTYQAVSGVYALIAILLGFQDWNSRKKSNKEIFSFLGIAAVAFCFAMLLFRFFLMKPVDDYASTAMLPLPHIVTGILNNIKNYVLIVNHDWGIVWKVGIALVILFFIIKSTCQSAQKRILSFFVSILVLGISFILSYGLYSLLATPLFLPRSLIGFGVFLAILCIYVVSDYKKTAIVTVLALNWCLLVFAFSYGNALADQARYAEFRITMLLHDLSNLYPNLNQNNRILQLKNSIDFAPTIKNIAKNDPIIERLVPKRLAEDYCWENYYFTEHFNFIRYRKLDIENVTDGNHIDFSTLNLPVVLDSYYHTIQSDGNRILVVLKH